MKVRELVKAYISLSAKDMEAFDRVTEYLREEVTPVKTISLRTVKRRLNRKARVTKRHRIPCKRCGRVTLKIKKNARFCNAKCVDAAYRERKGLVVSSKAVPATKEWKATLLKGDQLRASG